MLVTREFKFDSAHYLEGYQGDCRNMHGHSWRFAVTVEGDVGDDGMVIDFKKLKAIVNEYVVSRLDHKLLNHVISFNPTAENISMVIWRILRQHIDEKFELKITLYETERNFVEYPAH